MSLKKVVECIRKNNNFLITAHTNLEGDALGSELAFYNLIRKLGKDATIINNDNLPSGYDFLPQKSQINKFKKDSNIRFDCLAVLDCADLTRTGLVSKIDVADKPILNIDHHISNQEFGDVNWVDPHASSCCEMIYKLYKRMHKIIDKNTATALYAGILTDTGSFRYSNTSAFTHKVAAHLLELGLSVSGIYKNVYQEVPFQDMELLLRILPDLRRLAGGRIVWFKITHKTLRGRKISFDLNESLLTFARAIKGVDVAAIFKENLGRKNEVKVSFRSNGSVDVNKIAQYFGGGGHKTASGATIGGNIDTISKRVLAKIKESLKA